MPLPPGLIYVNDQEPGIRRERRGRGFSYRLPNGELLNDIEQMERIRALGLPPAYKDVWICMMANGHLQATGLDDRGRKQYRYHEEWHALRDEKKYSELPRFGTALPKLRRRARIDAETIDGTERSTLGALTLLLDAAHLRVGNQCYLQTNGTYGATTLLKKHIRFGEVVELAFAAKGGKKIKQKLRAPRLQKILERIADLPGRKLFVWQDKDGVVHPVDSGQLNRYLSATAGVPISAKTFRTWGGTVAAFEKACSLLNAGEKPTIRSLCEAAADELSNTPAVCRKSYVHPGVLALATDDLLCLRLKRQLGRPVRTRDGMRVSEQRLLAYLRSYLRPAKR
ncbi:DNA topoisomerase IB [Rhizobium halophytocola]|uniref:DNA topoisomerase IB n=1 Tax=Rhizobium halophytocola TaxID=735519 RepID=UPI00360C08D7